MKEINFDRLPHLFYHSIRIVYSYWSTFFARILAWWWGVQIRRGCKFVGLPHFKRYPGSSIVVGKNCKFNSSPASNWIGVNRPCMISTLKEGAKLTIGEGCGFSGAVIACASLITIGRNVRCGANTLINDTDWHSDDPRTSPDAPVEICDNVWLGANVTVLKGVTIGEGAMIGMGSVVNRSVPARVVAVGVPVKVIRSLEKF
jgi:acetyltransferase-like isoleucine patch superfamily enzyme